MAQSIHAHAIIEMIMQLPNQPPRQTLEQMISDKFGDDALFHSCAASDMDVHGLMDFLISMGKIKGDDGKLHSGGCGCG